MPNISSFVYILLLKFQAILLQNFQTTNLVWSGSFGSFDSFLQWILFGDACFVGHISVDAPNRIQQLSNVVGSLRFWAHVPGQSFIGTVLLLHVLRHNVNHAGQFMHQPADGHF